MTRYAQLTATYKVYLAMHDVELDVPAGTEFELYAQTRHGFIGMYKHPQYGDMTIDTPDAVEITPLAPGMFILHGKK